MGNSSTRALVPIQRLEVPQQPGKSITDHSSGRLAPSFFKLVETADNFCCSLVAVMSGRPIIDSNRGLLARPHPSASLTTTICPAWRVRLAFRLSIRAALEATETPPTGHIYATAATGRMTSPKRAFPR